MGIALTKDSIDLGIIVTDGEAALAFYRDVVVPHISRYIVPPPGIGCEPASVRPTTSR